MTQNIYNSWLVVQQKIDLHLHLSDAYIQSDLQYIQAIHFLSVCVFPGNWTHNICAANAMLYHWTTETLKKSYISI